MLQTSRWCVSFLITSLMFGSAASAGDCPREWTAGWTRTQVDRQVRALTTFDFDGPGPQAASLVIAGDFFSINGVVSPSPVVYHGGRFAPLRAGLRAVAVRQFVTLDADGDGPQPIELFAAGTFTPDSGSTSVGVIRWASGTPGQSGRWLPLGTPSASGLTSALNLTGLTDGGAVGGWNLLACEAANAAGPAAAPGV